MHYLHDVFFFKLLFTFVRMPTIIQLIMLLGAEYKSFVIFSYLNVIDTGEANNAQFIFRNISMNHVGFSMCFLIICIFL